MARSRRGLNILVQVCSIIAAFALTNTAANSEDQYPSKPVRIVVSFAAGGPTDTVARIIGAKLTSCSASSSSSRTGPARAAISGADVAAKSPPDGYTLLMATVSTHAINPGLYSKMPYDPVQGFRPGRAGRRDADLLGVHPSMPATDVRA